MNVYTIYYWSIDETGVIVSFKNLEDAQEYMQNIYDQYQSEFECIDKNFMRIANDKHYSKYYYEIVENHFDYNDFDQDNFKNKILEIFSVLFTTNNQTKLLASFRNSEDAYEFIKNGYTDNIVIESDLNESDLNESDLNEKYEIIENSLIINQGQK